MCEQKVYALKGTYLWFEVERFDLFVPLNTQLRLLKPCRLLLRLKVWLIRSREHFLHEYFLDTMAILFHQLADSL